MYIAAAMISILFDVSDGIRVENCMPSISTLKPASLPISLIRSTITPSMVLVLVSRKVKGMPVGVEPTFSTWSSACAPNDARVAKTTAATPVLNDMNSPLLCQCKKSGTRREATQWDSLAESRLGEDLPRLTTASPVQGAALAQDQSRTTPHESCRRRCADDGRHAPRVRDRG